MSSLLEFHDFELTRYYAIVSPTAREKFNSELKSRRFSMSKKSQLKVYSEEDIVNSREEILKLSERVCLLRTHCEESIEQVIMTCIRT